MKNKTLNSFIKTVDNDVTTVKLIETTVNHSRSFTIEIKQGLFITELQYGFDKVRALILYGALIDCKLDIYIDKNSVKQIECDNCAAKNTMLISFDNEMQLCENCAAQYGLESLTS